MCPRATVNFYSTTFVSTAPREVRITTVPLWILLQSLLGLCHLRVLLNKGNLFMDHSLLHIRLLDPRNGTSSRLSPICPTCTSSVHRQQHTGFGIQQEQSDDWKLIVQSGGCLVRLTLASRDQSLDFHHSIGLTNHVYQCKSFDL